MHSLLLEWAEQAWAFPLVPLGAFLYIPLFTCIKNLTDALGFWFPQSLLQTQLRQQVEWAWYLRKEQCYCSLSTSKLFSNKQNCLQVLKKKNGMDLEASLLLESCSFFLFFLCHWYLWREFLTWTKQKEEEHLWNAQVFLFSKRSLCFLISKLRHNVAIKASPLALSCSVAYFCP